MMSLMYKLLANCRLPENFASSLEISCPGLDLLVRSPDLIVNASVLYLSFLLD